MSSQSLRNSTSEQQKNTQCAQEREFIHSFQFGIKLIEFECFQSPIPEFSPRKRWLGNVRFVW
jgi:hypothetical protein